ncbi:MAG: hypothetical protein AAF903_04085 [Pseudomonadota bacterium]
MYEDGPIHINTLAVAKLLESEGFERQKAEQITRNILAFLRAEHERGVSREEIARGLGEVSKHFLTEKAR